MCNDDLDENEDATRDDMLVVLGWAKPLATFSEENEAMEVRAARPSERVDCLRTIVIVVGTD